MTGEIRASLSAVAAATLLLACASKAPVSSAPASASDETTAEYQRLVDNAGERQVCKKQTPLGTRVPTVVCFTQAELKAQREHRDEVMHDLETNASARDAMADRAPPPPSPSPR